MERNACEQSGQREELKFPQKVMRKSPDVMKSEAFYVAEKEGTANFYSSLSMGGTHH